MLERIHILPPMISGISDLTFLRFMNESGSVEKRVCLAGRRQFSMVDEY